MERLFQLDNQRFQRGSVDLEGQAEVLWQRRREGREKKWHGKP